MRPFLQRVLAHGRGRSLLPWVVLSVCLLFTSSGAAPQNPNPPEIQAHEGPSHDVMPTFQLHVERNLVTVRVVVRDANDRPVGNLRQEDFRLSDDGKPQDISGFAVETAESQPCPGSWAFCPGPDPGRENHCSATRSCENCCPTIRHPLL